MWDLAVREEDYDAVDAMLSRFARAPLSMRLLPVFARGDSAARARFVVEATNSDSRQSQISVTFARSWSGSTRMPARRRPAGWRRASARIYDCTS